MTAIRAVLAVALAVALLSVALPLVDEGRVDRSATRLDAATGRLERAARSLLAHEDPTPPGVAGARRLVSVRLPVRSWTSVRATLRIDGDDDAVAYRLAGRRPHRTVLRGVDLRTPDGPVVFESPGRHRISLSLIRHDGVGVVVRRA